MFIVERFLAKYFLKKTFKERKKLKEYFPVQFNFHPTSCPSINELSLFLYNLELILLLPLCFSHRINNCVGEDNQKFFVLFTVSN